MVAGSMDGLPKRRRSLDRSPRVRSSQPAPALAWQRSSPAGWRRGGRGSRSCLGTRRPPRAGRHRSARRGARRPSVSPCARAPASGCMTRTNLAANNAACRRAPATAAAWARRRRSTSTGGGCVSRPDQPRAQPRGRLPLGGRLRCRVVDSAGWGRRSRARDARASVATSPRTISVGRSNARNQDNTNL